MVLFETEHIIKREAKGNHIVSQTRWWLMNSAISFTVMAPILFQLYESALPGDQDKRMTRWRGLVVL